MVTLKLVVAAVSQAQILDCLQLAAHQIHLVAGILLGNMYLVDRILAQVLDTAGTTVTVRQVAHHLADMLHFLVAVAVAAYLMVVAAAGVVQVQAV